jgi:hypothetical protein
MSFKHCLRFAVTSLASLLVVLLGAAAQQSTPALPKNHAKQGTKNSSRPPAKDFYENPDSLSLEGSNLQSLPPVLLENRDLPGDKFTREHIRLTWRPLDSVDLYVAVPKGVKKPPVILYLYSYPESTARFLNNPWTDSTTSGGFASVGFASTLTAERIPEGRPAKEWFVSELHESLVVTAHDVQMILNYLASRGDLDMDHVGMFGVGSGGTIAILASAVDPRIKALDVFDPWGDWPSWVAKSSIVPEDQRPKFLSPEFLKSVAPFDPVHWLPRVKAQVVRIQSVRSESTSPEDSQKNMEAAAPDIAEILQFGDYSALMAAAPPSSVFDWLKLVLPPDSKYKLDPDKSKRVHFFPALSKKFEPAGTHP